jgi:hypothetical protein
MKQRNYSWGDVFTGNIMSSLSFPILMQSTLSGIFNKKIRFEITNKGQGGRLPYIVLWPWMLIMLLNLAAIINGFFRYSENHYAIGINMFWCLYHIWLVSNIFKFNKSPVVKEKTILNHT